ncbi:MAG: DUF2079 domain-containing protein [Chloroflexi bacterium]|nr:DUF2079 domain-containing protein [Chloroflexota bacterium]
MALTVAAMGAYVILSARQWRIGAATIAGSLAWFVLVAQVVMPALRGNYGPVPFPGYGYLGEGVWGIAGGIFTNTGELLNVIAAQAKQDYIYWLLAPLAFVSLLAPDVLLVALPALLVILASNFPPTYEIFERYVAPVIPPVFVAACIGLSRISRIFDALRTQTRLRTAVSTVLLLGMAGATVYAQSILHKFPASLLSPAEPDPHFATAIGFTQVIPEVASVVVEDHRWLARLAHRKGLYFLSATSPDADYLLVDRRRAPVTNVPAVDREQAIRRIAGSESYASLRCEDGLMLYGNRSAIERDGALFAPYEWEHDLNKDFGGLIRLLGYSLDNPSVRAGDTVAITLYWQAVQEPITFDFTVFVNLLDRQWRSVGQHDGRPNDSTCSTLDWKRGLIVQDWHVLSVKSDAAPGDYDLRIGLYTQADMKRLGILGPNGNVVDDNVAIPLSVHP